MLMQRILGAFTFKREVYADVEHDTSFTNTAWGIVAFFALLAQVPAFFGPETEASSPLTIILSIILSLLGFALGAYVMAWVGKALFQADVTYEELVRTLGLAYVWRFLGVVPVLNCIVWIFIIAAWFIAVREALDLDTGQTIITVIIGGLVSAFVSSMAALIF